MKQVKSLVLAVFLVFALSPAALGGDIGSPGIRTTTSGDIGSPTTQSTTPEETGIALDQTETSDTSDIYNSLLLETTLALLALL